MTDEDHKIPFVGGPNTHHKSKMAAVHRLGKIEKLPYLSSGLTDRNEIWEGDAV